MDLADHCAHISNESSCFGALLDGDVLDRPVPTCPGWNLRRLTLHLGAVHRWATAIVVSGQRANAPEDPTGNVDLHQWFLDGAAALVDALGAVDPTRPTWNPWPAPDELWVWSRRQAQETAVHRWDGEHALRDVAAIDAGLAADGLDEHFDIGISRVSIREESPIPTGSLHVHCTDVAGEWLAWSEHGEYRMTREHRKGDAAIRGPAGSILLAMLGRHRDGDLDIVGDRAIADAWLALPGL